MTKINISTPKSYSIFFKNWMHGIDNDCEKKHVPESVAKIDPKFSVVDELWETGNFH